MRNITVCSLALSVLALSVVAQEAPQSGIVNRVRADEGIPCYVVVSNLKSDDDERRDMMIMMNKDDVNEGNFIKLQRFFSAMYPDVEQLSVRIETSLSYRLGNYITGKDRESLRATLAGLPYDYKPKVWEKDARGFLWRDGETEKFAYKGEGGDIRDMKYVLVEGEDPYCGDCKRLESHVPDFAGDIASAPKNGDRGVSCYFVLGNVVINNRRFIRLLINSQDGNEPTLQGLLRHFVQQYPEPNPLVIKVYTNLVQEEEFLGLSVSRYFVAALFRANDNQVIRYQQPQGKPTTLVVQGFDIFPSLDNYLETEGRGN